MTQMPPCVVLGIESQVGLGIIRELGRTGVKVIGIALTPRAIGLSSRYLWRRYILPDGLDEKALNLISGLGEELGGIVLLTVSEPSIAWLHRHKLRLGKVRPVVPPAQAFDTVLNKKRILGLAQKLGISVPTTIEPTSIESFSPLMVNLKFPVVLKWSDPIKVMPILRQNKIELAKCEYALNPKELLAILQRYNPVGVFPLVQEYCPGRGLGQFFFMYKGEAIRRFQHLRVAEWPPEGGFSAVCEAVPLSHHRALQQKSIDLLKAIDWEGVAMVEYRYDGITDTAVLMEINGRFWGSFPLAVQCRAGFALLSYNLAGCGRTPSLESVREDQRCRMLATEVKRIHRILWRDFRSRKTSLVVCLAEIKRFVTDFFKPNVGYYVWSLDDPRPFFADVLTVISGVLRKMVNW